MKTSKNKAQTKDVKKVNKSNNQQNRKSKKSSNEVNKNKINYVLHPRLLKKKIDEQKQEVKREKLKSFQVKKRKRNAAFMKTTEKGQPKLNARMKILYDQIARSCGENK